MTASDDGEDARALALTHWRLFCRQALPGTLRRIAAWKGVPPHAFRDLLEDIVQELAADCLAHAAVIAALPLEPRHARWMRLMERMIYQERFAVRRRRGGDLTECAGPGLAADWATIAGAPAQFDLLVNGRCNLARTAAAAGVTRRRLRLQHDELGRRCGADDEQRAFWRRRLAEALAGLAADLLRVHERVRLAPRPRQPPDIAARQQRLRRLGTHFPRHAATRRERALIRRWTRARRFGASAPAELLAEATALAPDSATAWAWRFEAGVADGDLAAAARALRAARRLPDLPAATAALARARLREARGDRRGAVRLLARAQRRRPRDRVLAAVARAAGVLTP
ncbi:MAG: hypothetical protein ACK6DH_08600 [Planctomycetota bacterium]